MKIYRIRIILVWLLLALNSPFYAQSPQIPNPDNYELVFSDEFSGTSLDWDIWGSQDAIATSPNGTSVGRWKENAILNNGFLELITKKGNRDDSEWTSGFVWLKQTFGSNTYYEARFKCTDATGVNNAFWTSVRETETKTYMNSYEIDVVEAKRLNNQEALTGHIAWHDWKPYNYTGGIDIGQGVVNTYNTTDYQTWGLWVGENSMIIYCDGVEQWRGTKSLTYPLQWETGVGKISTWYTNEEKRAYGKYSQDDWSYTGGMNGDDMNICFSTMPWTVTNSTLTDAADNSSMSIDYLRVYKLKSDLNENPVQFISQPEKEVPILLDKPVSLADSNYYYFSVLVERNQIDSSSINLYAGDTLVANLMISEDNNLLIKNDSSSVSTQTSYPATQALKMFFEPEKQYLLVGRITAQKEEKDVISFTTFELAKTIPSREPFLYRNIDDDGNSSITNEWSINKKIQSSQSINKIILKGGSTNYSQLKIADNYRAVVASYLNKPTAYIYGEHKSTTEFRIYMKLSGELPFSVTYTDGDETKTLSISDESYTFLVTPQKTTTYNIVSATDANGESAIIGGMARFFIASDTEYDVLSPIYDTYFTEDTENNPETESNIFVSNADGAQEDAYYLFQLPEPTKQVSSANLYAYLTSKSPIDTCKITLFGSNEEINAQSNWTNSPSNWEKITDMILGSNTGLYIDFDVTSFYNKMVEQKSSYCNFKLILTGGSDNTTLKLKPGHNTTTSVPTRLFLKESTDTYTKSLITDDTNIIYYQDSRVLKIYSSYEIKNVNIFDISGRKIMNSKNELIPIPKNLSGLFIVQISTSAGQISKQIIIK